MASSRWWLSHEWYPRILFGLLVILSILLGIAPHDRADWLLENALLFAAMAVLAATHRALPLSRVSYTLIFVFVVPARGRGALHVLAGAVRRVARAAHRPHDRRG